VEQIRRWLGDASRFAWVESIKDRVGLTDRDGEDLTWLFDQVTSWLHVYGSGSLDP
jgi:hypothetical protein